jgi:hypothetical protein
VKPLLFRERNAVGRMVSLRVGKISFDSVRKSDGFFLMQLGRRRTWFVCRLAAHAKKPPLFLFRRTSVIKWMLGDFMLGFTMEPMTLDDYWRAKGWLTTDRNTSTPTISSGTGAGVKEGPSILKGL